MHQYHFLLICCNFHISPSRLKTFARYGLQQIQVDCHYLHLYLWRFVEDEAVVTHLLDEIMSSALLRSLDQPPVLMEPSVVEVICDKV